MPYVFITLENEFGPVNVILRPQVYAKYHKVGRMEPFIVVDGYYRKGTASPTRWLITCLP